MSTGTGFQPRASATIGEHGAFQPCTGNMQDQKSSKRVARTRGTPVTYACKCVASPLGFDSWKPENSAKTAAHINAKKTLQHIRIPQDRSGKMQTKLKYLAQLGASATKALCHKNLVWSRQHRAVADWRQRGKFGLTMFDHDDTAL
jgi:hypothetical protein